MKLAQKIAVSYFRTKFKLLTVVSSTKAAEKAFDLFRTPQRRSKKPAPKIFEQAEKLTFKLDGITIHGWRWNHPAERKVLIIHGFESSATSFDRYVKPLVKKGYEVLAFDAPAHGKSGSRQITAPLYAKTIIEINQRYGPIQSFMAHSFGGLAVSLALEEIHHTSDTRLVLIAPATETTTAINTFFHFLKLDDALRSEFEKIIIKTGGHPSSWYSIRRAMKHIRAQVLWLHDEDDEITPLTDAYKVKEENYPNIQFVISKGLGHRRIYRDNKVSKAIVDFL
ncbi:MAG: alpha/beta fold hydrolase [Chitinophagales bacterium]|nr:alpha/beta fold hydrolase [Chitinophagales bacterium]